MATKALVDTNIEASTQKGIVQQLQDTFLHDF